MELAWSFPLGALACYSKSTEVAVAEPTVVLWDVGPRLGSACEAVARERGAPTSAVSGALASPACGRPVRLAVVGGCSAASIRERLLTAGKQLPNALVAGVVPPGDLAAAAAAVSDLERIALVEEGGSAIQLALELLEAGSVEPSRWPAGFVASASRALSCARESPPPRPAT